MQIAAVRLTEGVNEAICTRWLSCLPGKRQEEILRRQRPKDRERSLSGEILARAMLARELRCPLRDVPICRETHGKPVLKDCTNLFFNISHSGDYAVCAVSKQPVGIDIERIGAYQPNVARRVCSDAEQKLLEQCEDPVSYTHLDVYKRQNRKRSFPCARSLRIPAHWLQSYLIMCLPIQRPGIP